MSRILAVVFALTALASVAQTTHQAAQKQPKPQVVNFENDLIEGGIEVPTTTYTLVQKRPDGFKSLIKIRENFNDKLRESVHEM